MTDRLAWMAVVVVALPMWLNLHHTHALSLCTHDNGRRVFTDSPSQFTRCTTIESDNKFAPSPPPTPVSPSIAELPAGPARHVLEPADPPAFSASVAVPVEQLGALLVVTAQLNRDRPTRLIVDTGASHTVLSHRVAQELGLFSLPPIALVTLQTVGGSVQAEVVQIESIQLAGAEVRQSLAAIHDLPNAPPGVEGLLGQSFLHQFEVTVNAAKGELRLRSAQ